jgi:hypothetical protein
MDETPVRRGLSKEAWVAVSGIGAAVITGVVTLLVHVIPPAQNASESTLTTSPEASLTTSASPSATTPNASATASPSDRAPDTDGSSTLLALRKAGIDHSVPEKDLKQWLANPQSTPYPSLAEALLRLLDGKRLRQPVAIDVIVYNYENTPGASSPRSVDDVDLDVLHAAVLEGFNTRHNTSMTRFQGLVE